jgi:hypothetical protein
MTDEQTQSDKPQSEHAREAAQVWVRAWNDDWSHFYTTIMAATGFTLEQAFLFHLAQKWAIIERKMTESTSMQEEAMPLMRRQIELAERAIALEEKERGDDWRGDDA